MKHIFDWASVVVTIGAIAKWLPAIAALLSIVWYLVRLYDRFVKGRVEGE